MEGSIVDRLVAESVTRVLYPDDSTIAGQALRFVQQYFLVSCSLSDIVTRFRHSNDDWKMLPEYRLMYDERVGGYIGRLFLKQGYYNYGFAVPDQNSNPDFSFLEGNWYATENQYTLITYYRPLGGQYDQLVGVVTFSTY